jgi:hypothetical protein
MRNFLLTLCGISCFAGSVVVRDGCGEDSSIVATIRTPEGMRVEHGVVGESNPCYAVSVAQSGNSLRGYVTDATLAPVVEFERTRALESRVPIPEPPPPPPGKTMDAKPKAPRPTGPPFEDWTGTDLKGRRLQIHPAESKITLVTFWAPQSATARRMAENLNKTQGEFATKGVVVVGLVQAQDPAKLAYYMEDMGIEYRLGFDRGLSGKYHADPNKGTTLVIDASNHIIASSSDPKEIRAAVLKLLSSE